MCDSCWSRDQGDAYLLQDMLFEVSYKTKQGTIKVYIFCFSTALDNCKALISPRVAKLLMLAWNMWSTAALKWLI